LQHSRRDLLHLSEVPYNKKPKENTL